MKNYLVFYILNIMNIKNKHWLFRNMNTLCINFRNLQFDKLLTCLGRKINNFWRRNEKYFQINIKIHYKYKSK